MNRLLLFSIVLVLFIFYGGKNVPKVMKDNKEILLGVVGGLVLCSFLGMNLEGVQTGSGGEPETLDCEKCIVRALREPQGSVMGIFRCIMGDPESQTPPSCSIDDDALKNCRCDGSVGCPAVTTETPNPSQDACEQAEEMAREASAGDTVAPAGGQTCQGCVEPYVLANNATFESVGAGKRVCIASGACKDEAEAEGAIFEPAADRFGDDWERFGYQMFMRPPAPPGYHNRETIPSSVAGSIFYPISPDEEGVGGTDSCRPHNEGNICADKNRQMNDLEWEQYRFNPAFWFVDGIDADECYYSVEDVYDEGDQRGQPKGPDGEPADPPCTDDDLPPDSHSRTRACGEGLFRPKPYCPD